MTEPWPETGPGRARQSLRIYRHSWGLALLAGTLAIAEAFGDWQAPWHLIPVLAFAFMLDVAVHSALGVVTFLKFNPRPTAGECRSWDSLQSLIHDIGREDSHPEPEPKSDCAGGSDRSGGEEE